jgi:phosphatidylserine/phosphatidylglycerophosphate/cardiolipin synthase-like enzyme
MPVRVIIQPDAGFAPILQAMRRAKRTIDIAIFRLDRREFLDTLGAAVARGVRVRALVAHTNRGGEAQLRKVEQQLLAAGVVVARTGDEFVKYHGKYLIIDDTLHLLGFNFAKRDVSKTRSFGIQTRERTAVRDAARLFEADMTRQAFECAPRSRLVISPENARATLERFVSGARKRLAIYDARLDDPSFRKLLEARAAAGVVVQILGKARKLDDVAVRPLKGLRQHVRAIVRDGTQVFIGSQSLRRLELDERREVGLIVTNPAVARRVMQVFEADWEESGAKADAESSDAADSPPPGADALAS